MADAAILNFYANLTHAWIYDVDIVIELNGFTGLFEYRRFHRLFLRYRCMKIGCKSTGVQFEKLFLRNAIRSSIDFFEITLFAIPS